MKQSNFNPINQDLSPEEHAILDNTLTILFNDYDPNSFNDYPIVIMDMLEGIHPFHIGKHLLVHAYPTDRPPYLIKTVAASLFRDIPDVIQRVEKLDPTEYTGRAEYIKALGGENLWRAYVLLCYGQDIPFYAIDEKGTELVVDLNIEIDGIEAQRRALLASEAAFYAKFDNPIHYLEVAKTANQFLIESQK